MKNVICGLLKGLFVLVAIVMSSVWCNGVQAEPLTGMYNSAGQSLLSAGVTEQPRAPYSSVGSYSPTIYEVGTNELPSDAYNPANTGQERANKPGIRTGHGDDNISGPEYGQSDSSPVGEPLVLLLCAAAFGAVIAMRRRRA